MPVPQYTKPAHVPQSNMSAVPCSRAAPGSATCDVAARHPTGLMVAIPDCCHSLPAVAPKQQSEICLQELHNAEWIYKAAVRGASRASGAFDTAQA